MQFGATDVLSLRHIVPLGTRCRLKNMDSRYYCPIGTKPYSNAKRFHLYYLQTNTIFMANTYTQIHIQFVFAVKNRQSLIQKEWKEDLHKYITGIVANQGHKLLAISGMSDHIHIFIGMRPTQSMSDLMQDIKGDSSKWINQNGFVRGKFEWQSGYGAFSYSRSHISNVIRYIENQEEHHRNVTFREEYIKMLEAFEIEYDEKYIFHEIE